MLACLGATAGLPIRARRFGVKEEAVAASEAEDRQAPLEGVVAGGRPRGAP